MSYAHIGPPVPFNGTDELTGGEASKYLRAKFIVKRHRKS